MFPDNSTRVQANTCQASNDRIRRRTEAGVARYGALGAQAIEKRLAELDQEWDVERCLETMAPSLSLLGLALGVTRSRRWLALPVIVQGFFLQHALQGWCPPLTVLRALGVRTVQEIDEERYALKAIRGDFNNVPHTSMLDAVQK